MLKNITNVSECEELFKKKLFYNNISFIGELELTEEDIIKLENMICSQIRQNENNELDNVLNKAPTCMAVLLVNKAIWDYSRGQYWSLDKIIPNVKNTALQNKLGNFFLNYLNENRLNNISLERAHRYVGNILLHSGIPQSCLRDFFEEVIVPLLRMGATTGAEIKQFITKVRKQNSKRLIIISEIKKLENKIFCSKNRIKKIDALIKLRQVNEEHNRILDDYINIPFLHEDFERYRTVKYKELAHINDEIDMWSKQRLLYEETVKMYGEKEKELIETISNLNINNEELQMLEKLHKEREFNHKNFVQAKKLLTAKMINVLNLYKEPDSEIVFVSEDVISSYNKYCRLRYSSNINQNIRYKNIKWIVNLISRLLRLFRSVINFRKETADKTIILDLKREIEKIFMDSFGASIKEELFSLSGEQFAAIINSLAENVTNYNQWLNRMNKVDKEIKELVLSIGQAASATEWASKSGILLHERLLEVREAARRRKNALLAKAKLAKIILPKLEELAKEKNNIETELAAKERAIKQLGEGDLEKGVSVVKKLSNVKHDQGKNTIQIRNIEKALGLKQDSEKSMLDKIRKETHFQITQCEECVKFKRQELSRYKRVYSYADEPVRRFVLYGEDWSCDFIIKSVELVRLASEGQLDNAWSIGLPDRIITWFEGWWQYGNQEQQVKGSKSERLTIPTLFLDTIYKELKLVTGKERINYTEKTASVELIISCPNDKKILAKAPLRAYSLKDGLLETLPLEVDINILRESYQVSIYLNDALFRSWTIRGFGTKDLFIAFTEDGKRQEIDKLKQTRYWLLINEGVVLETTTHIIEEARIDFIDRSVRLILVDLETVNRLHFKDDKGNKHKVIIHDSESLMPEIEEQGRIPNVSIEGTPVYADRMPTIKIPISEMNDLSYWLFILEDEKGQYVIRSNIFAIEGLEINEVTGSACLDLNAKSISHLLGTGMYNIILYYLDQEVLTYKFTYIPGLKVVFDQYIYPPQAKGAQKHIKISMTKPTGTEVSIHHPAEISRVSPRFVDVVTSFEEDNIECDLKAVSKAGQISVYPLIINIPKLKWRLISHKRKSFPGWSDRLEEIWFGDLEQVDDVALEILCPNLDNRYIQLFINDYEQEQAAPVNQGRVQFDISCFNDTIRRSKLPVQVFNLNIREGGRKTKLGPVLSVRSKWEVYDLTYSIKSEESECFLELQWKEKGRAEHRAIKFWNLDAPWQDTYATNISDDTFSLLINQAQKYLPKGKYLAHFYEEDPWRPQNIGFPPKDNTFIIDMDYGQVYLANCKIQVSNKGKVSFIGEFLNTPSKADVNLLLLGIRNGKVLLFEQKACIQDGKLNVNLSPKEFACTVHWLIIRTLGEASYYWILALTKDASLEWPIGKDRGLIEKFLDLDNVFLKLVYEDRGISKSCSLEELSKPILTDLISKRDFERKSRYPVKGAKLRWVEKKQQAYLDLPIGGVICNTCGRFFRSQKEWYAHNPFSVCKSLTVRVKKVDAQLLFCFNFSDIYNQFSKRFPMIENDAIILYDSDTRPLPKELLLIDLCNKKLQALLETLLIREIELCKRFMGVTDNEP
ncbi:MAG: hypothetical protein GX918_04645 [Clostridiales bacterium]|jgi:hypothetical protein|nr:hypothetical protein [Clostridiales bacterium]